MDRQLERQGFRLFVGPVKLCEGLRDQARHRRIRETRGAITAVYKTLHTIHLPEFSGFQHDVR